MHTRNIVGPQADSTYLDIPGNIPAPLLDHA